MNRPHDGLTAKRRRTIELARIRRHRTLLPPVSPGTLGGITGSGTAGNWTKWVATETLGDALGASDDGTTITLAAPSVAGRGGTLVALHGGAAGGNVTIFGGAGSSTGPDDGSVYITSGDGSGAGTPGYIVISAGIAGTTGTGGLISLFTGTGGTVSGDGGAFSVTTGDGGPGGTGGAINLQTGGGVVGGDINLIAGINVNSGSNIIFQAGDSASGTPTVGKYKFARPTPSGGGGIFYGDFNFNALTADRTYTFANKAGNVVTTTGASVAAHVLSFLAADSTDPVGSPNVVGTLSSVLHDSVAQTVTKLVGIVGNASVRTATGFNAVVTNGVTGSVSSDVPAALAGKVLACFSGSFSRLNTVGDMEPLTKDITFGKGVHPAGGYDHLTVLWGPNFSLAATSGYPAAANLPGITSTIRATIQDWGAGATAGTAQGEYWAIRGENINGAVATFPAHTGYIRMTYPRRTGGTTPAVHATHAWWEPWPNTATIRGGALKGDTYFDDGTNFRIGLWEYDGTNWYKLLQHKSVDAISGAVGPATLAVTTGGATGPAVAAQNTWLQVVGANGTSYWVPAWV